MPRHLNSFRLWALVALLVVAVATGTALRATGPDADAMRGWSPMSVI